MKSLQRKKSFINTPDILIIDDDSTIIRILTIVLERAGYSVRSFQTARDGVNAALRKTPDAVLLDYMLPERSGLEILADFRQCMDLLNTPVIMLTASNEASVVKTAILEGVNDYLLKPVDPETLLARLARLLGDRSPSRPIQDPEPADLEQEAEEELPAVSEKNVPDDNLVLDEDIDVNEEYEENEQRDLVVDDESNPPPG